MLRYREFDVAEMSLSSYCVSLARDPQPFIAIPVFPSRFFRHSCIFVSAASGHPRAARPDRQARRQPRVPDDRAGLDPRHPAGRVRRPRRRRDLLHRRRGGARPRREAQARPAARASASSASARRRRSPRCWPTARSTRCTRRARRPPSARRPGTVRRLFEDYVEVEKAYYRQHAHLPDHAHGGDPPRAVRGSTRWIAQSLYKAFIAAQRRTYADLEITDALKVMLPWLTAHVEEARALMGDDFWPYGFAPEPPRARHLPALSPRAGALPAPPRPGGAVRARDAGGVPDLNAQRSTLRPT